MSWVSKGLGFDGKRERRENDKWAAYGGTPQVQLQDALNSERTGGGWKSAFNDTAGAFLSSQMPSLLGNLQMTREDAIRRGISTGDLGTSYEGDLVSAFQRNLSNTLGGLAMQGYENNRNRYLSILSGKLDSDQAYKNAQQQGMLGLGQLGIGAASLFV